MATENDHTLATEPEQTNGAAAGTYLACGVDCATEHGVDECGQAAEVKATISLFGVVLVSDLHLCSFHKKLLAGGALQININPVRQVMLATEMPKA